MNKVIRIGTRQSELALKQAHQVGQLLSQYQLAYDIVPIDSKGDLDLKTPLYQLGITGVFTKALDIALLDGRIDIAVHSLKDVPTILPKGISIAAVLERDYPSDVLVLPNDKIPDFESSLTIATGSMRRKAQWLHKYPNHHITGLRGNVNTRLKKLEDSDWAGAIFSAAGLERIDLMPDHHILLDWMIPAPAQGIVAIAALEEHTALQETINKLNHKVTEITSAVEREFLNELEGGCSAPIGAFATITDNELTFQGILNSPDGSREVKVQRSIALEEVHGFGRHCAKEILQNGGDEIMNQIKSK